MIIGCDAREAYVDVERFVAATVYKKSHPKIKTFEEYSGGM